MNANQITFGIEIECFLPTTLFVRGNIRMGERHRGIQVPGLPVGWNAQSDSSVHGLASGMSGVEIVSPVLTGAEGLRQVQTVCKQLNEWGAKVNRSCGLHVHVGWNGEVSQLRNLVHLVANFEKAIYASTGTHSREAGGYCDSIRQDFRNLEYRGERLGGPAGNRYHVLNLSNLLTGEKHTVEFRAFAGTTNFQKIAGHVQMCIGLVERAMKMSRATNWDSKAPVATSPVHRSGEGQTQLTRLYYQLGWIKGRTDHVYGNLAEAGLPTIKELKAELMRLAKKYDTNTQD